MKKSLPLLAYVPKYDASYDLSSNYVSFKIFRKFKTFLGISQNFEIDDPFSEE